ncbi:MAG TPA: methionine gamma-lyase family protein [Candidatus Baltobacteraceae bacterium]|nr:methionine gamma-lyase family protein [Candidatus Baltobacteraceae bacterium]
MIDTLCEKFNIHASVREAALKAQSRVRAFEYPAQAQAAANVLAAFSAEGVSESDFATSLGYGYDDPSREHYESLLCRIFGAERALARLTFASGTHAIVASLAACVPPGKTLLAITGKPYDTLRNAIVTAEYSLCSTGVQYVEEDWLSASMPPGPSIPQDDMGAIFIQRSRGYAPRRSATIADIDAMLQRARELYPGVPVLVDNCYGELVEEREPTHVGADLVMGSLIKNLGGTFAPAGGYVAGRADLIERIAVRLYAPGLRTALGPTLGYGRELLQGLFTAPLIVEQTLRGLDFAAALFEELGYGVDPLPGSKRTDIVQAIRLGDPDKLVRFARGLQQAMPVNARFSPEPGPVPGYVDPVIMSSGAFVNGATIELSCDAPLRNPYEVYLQGGVQLAHSALGAMLAAQALL